MDEGYLEWLQGLPGFDEAKARRLLDRFPSFEHLRAATREELLSVPGLEPDDMDALGRVLGDRAGRDDDGHLFLCPECGSFAGAKASSCPVCGIAFEEGSEEVRVPEDLKAFLEEEDHPSHLCSTCGAAMAVGADRCEVCGRSYTREEAALLPGIDAFVEETSAFCPRCGAYLAAESSECAICGRRPEAEAEPTNGHKGIGRGFLSRWQRVAESVEVSESDRLHEELDNLGRILDADPSLERAWAKKGRILGGLGRAEEAIAAFSKAADLNPTKEEEYRLDVLNLLRAQGDMSVLPSRWKQPAATDAPKAVDTRLLEALRHYDDLLHLDPNLAVAWRTKGEILERIGRLPEAREAFDRADFLEHHEGHSLTTALNGLQTRGALTARGTASGRVNGRTNGRVNGRTNGRTNGRVNGLASGRVNGLTNGAVNGLTLGSGATNGLGGWSDRDGRTNGLVNGNGFTNGRRGRYGTTQIPSQAHWARSVVGIAAVVALMVLAPILASLMSPAPEAGVALRIDGDFSDWSGVASFADSSSDQVANPDVNLLEVRAATETKGLFVYAHVQGLFFRGSGPEGTDGAYVFVDQDGRGSTGYPVGDLGADLVAELVGWGGTLQSASVYRFNATGGPSSNDWGRFGAAGGARAAFSGQSLEVLLSDVELPPEGRVLVVLADREGRRDAADGAIQAGRATVVVDQRTVAPDVIPGTSAGVLRVALRPLGGIPDLYGLNVTRRGSSADPATLVLREDDGDDRFESSDPVLGSGPLIGASASLPLSGSLTSPRVLWVEAVWANVTPVSTFGLEARGVWTNGSVTFPAPETGLAYLGTAPTTLRVDGAFGDWSGRSHGTDLLGDAINASGSSVYNPNVDLLATAVDLGANFTAYARVDGRILGGEDIPLARVRAPGVAPLDSDRDGVPDSVELSLSNPGLANDFNNDGVLDNATGDVDADGLIDYPAGSDLWLNTTIPSWYPAPFAGRNVTRYIGPIAPEVLEGVDVLYAYVDADNSTATGLLSDVAGSRYGFDRALVVLGRNGGIVSRGLYEHARGSAVPWRYVGPIEATLDAHRVEFGVAASALNLSAGYRVVFVASDWRRGYDDARPEAGATTFPVAPRAVATTVVINEVSPQPNPEWIEVANPTSSPVSLSGWDIVIVRGNRATVIYTFTNQVLGAWGSGTEYFVAIPPSNSLPNGNNVLRLRQNGVVVDQTTYSSNAGSGRSWARFKDPLTGQPMDSNNDVADFYVSLLPSPGRGNDRHRPVVTIAKVASAPSASPGDLVTYTIYYNNTGTGVARNVWVNDTLPAGVTYVGASVAPSSVAGSTLGWTFTNVLPGSTNSFTVTVQVNGLGADGSSQVNTARLVYTDQLRRIMEPGQAWANVTVVRPMIAVAKVVSPASAVAGDTVTYTIYYNNTGSVAAGTVTIRDSLPSGLTYTGSNPAPSWTDGTTFYWNFTNVAPGAYSITLTAVVAAGANTTQIVNWAFLNYTTLGGYALAPSTAAVVLAIPELTDFAFVLAVPLLIIGLRLRSRGRREKEEGVADSVPRAGGR